MPRSGTGSYSAPGSTWSPGVNGVTATTSDWNTLLADLAAGLTQSVSNDGQTPFVGNLPMGNNKVTGLANGTATTDALAVGQLYARYGQAGPVVFRNRVHNGSFNVNQRVVSGTVVLAAGVHGHDRWKAGSGGCTYTFSTSGITTTLTISAGSLEQVIEGADVEGGVYCMSWSGTATGKIGGGSFSASGVNSSSQTAGSDLSIEFDTGTLADVQVEPGTTATPFERRPIALEVSLCQRYFYRINGAKIFGIGQATSTSTVSLVIAFPVTMRVQPTAIGGTASLISALTATGTAVAANASVLGVSGVNTASVNLTLVSASFVAGNAAIVLGNAAGSFLSFTADL